MSKLYYDPPGGWRFGFPKEYKPLPGEHLKDTLIRDEYPEEDIMVDKENGYVKYVRFFSSD